MKTRHPRCYTNGCKNKPTTTTYWGPTGNRYEVSVCEQCKESMAESDRDFARLMTGFAEYNAYYDSKK